MLRYLGSESEKKIHRQVTEIVYSSCDREIEAGNVCFIKVLWVV